MYAGGLYACGVGVNRGTDVVGGREATKGDLLDGAIWFYEMLAKWRRLVGGWWLGSR